MPQNDNDSPAGMPRWVKVFGIIGGVLVAAIVAMLLTGHGPGHHLHGAGPASLG
jgi:hypothetical protein